MSLAAAFEPLRAALEYAEIRYAIGGSWASTAFGEPRFTNDLDILGEFTEQNLERFLSSLPDTFYVDAEEALTAIRRGRSFNAIYLPIVFKVDFFPAAAFALGFQELDRAIYLTNTELTKAPVPFVTPEDIVLAKLFWFMSGGESSDVQWRDIQGILGSCAGSLDRDYMQRAAVKVGILDLLGKALKGLR